MTLLKIAVLAKYQTVSCKTKGAISRKIRGNVWQDNDKLPRPIK
jgi:hypothetical protein